MFLEKMIRSLQSKKYILDDNDKEPIHEISDIGIDTSFIDTGYKIFHTTLDLPEKITVSIKVIKQFVKETACGSVILDNNILWTHNFYSNECKAHNQSERLLEENGVIKALKFLFNGIIEDIKESNSDKSLQGYFKKSLPNVGDTIGIKKFATFDKNIVINFTRDKSQRVYIADRPLVTTLLIPYGGFHDIRYKNFETKQVYAIFKVSVNEKKQISFVTENDVKQNTRGKIDLIHGPLSCDGHVIEIFGDCEKELIMSLSDFINAKKLKLSIKGDDTFEYVSESFIQEKISSDLLTIVFKKEEKCQNYQQHMLYQK